MRALWSARVSMSPKRVHHGALDGAPSRCPRARPGARAARRRRCRPAASSARASANLPFAVIGFDEAKKARTCRRTRLSSHSALSARRRSIVAFGQLGLSATEGGEAVEARVVLVAAQDRPFDELARERIGDRLLDRAWPRWSCRGEPDRAPALRARHRRQALRLLSVAASGAAGSEARRARRGVDAVRRWRPDSTWRRPPA